MPSTTVDVIQRTSGATRVDRDLDRLEKKAQSAWTRNRATYAYFGQLSNILLNQMEGAVQGAQALAGVQVLQAGVTAAMGEVAVFQTAAQAAAAFASGNVIGGIALTTISASLQTSIIAALIQKFKAGQLSYQADEIKRQMRSYRQ